MRRTLRRAIEQDNILTSVNDLLIGVLFLFIIIMMTVALQFSQKRESLEQLSVSRLTERSALLQRLKNRLEASHSPTEIDKESGVLRFRADLLFLDNDAKLQPAGLKALRILAHALSDELPCFGRSLGRAACPYGKHPIIEAVYVEGHTDARPPRKGSRYPSNWELSSARAISAFNALREMADSLPGLRNPQGQSMLGVSAYAETRSLPQASDQLNRRVEFRFLLSPPTAQEIELATER